MEDIERMAHDLRAERIKATNALKERARLKVENESLQQQLFAVKDSVSVTKSSMDSLKKDLSDMNIELEKSMNEGKHAKAVIERLEDTISTMEQEKIDLHKTGEAAAESSRDMQSQIFRLEEECLLLKGKLEASEEMVRKMEVGTTEAVLAKSALEEANAAHLDKVRKKTAVLEGMRDRIAKAEALELANKQLTSANEALKVELSNALDSGAKLTDSARKFAREDVERTLARDVLTGEVSRLKQELEDSLSSLHAAEDANTALQGRLAAEVESHEYCKQRGAGVERRMETLKKELESTKNTLDDVTTRYNEAESALVQIKLDLSAAESANLRGKEMERENVHLSTRVEDLTAKLNEARDAKRELFDMKKRLVKADMEGLDASVVGLGLDDSDVDGVPMKSAANQESRVSIGHEITIRELRGELAHSDAKLQECLVALSDSRERAHQLSRVEEELEIVKVTAKELAAEKQQQIDAATEANTLSMKLLASKESAMREIMSLEHDLESTRKECEYLTTTLGQEKSKNRQLYTEKLGVERRVAELIAQQSRSNGSLEEEKNRFLESEFELERVRRTVRDRESEIESLKLTLWQEKHKNRSNQGTDAAEDRGKEAPISRSAPASAATPHTPSTFQTAPRSLGTTAEKATSIMSPSAAMLAADSSAASGEVGGKRVAPNTNAAAFTGTSTTQPTPGALPHDVVELQSELEQVRFSHTLAQREVQSLKESLKVQRRGFDNALSECRRLHEENRKLQDLVELQGGTDSITPETGNISTQHSKSSARNVPRSSPDFPSPSPDKDLQDLRSELSETVSAMNSATLTTRHKAKLLMQLQEELGRERGVMQEMKDKLGRLEAKEMSLTGKQPSPSSKARRDLSLGEDGDRLEALLAEAEAKNMLPASPMAMMDYSAKSLEHSKSKIGRKLTGATFGSPQETAGSDRGTVPLGSNKLGLGDRSPSVAPASSSIPQEAKEKVPVVDSVADTSVAERASGTAIEAVEEQKSSGGNNDGRGCEFSLHRGEEDVPLTSSSLNTSTFSQDPNEAAHSFEKDIRLITSRKTSLEHSAEMSNHKRRLAKNHERERALRSQAMAAVQKLNRSEMEAAAGLGIAHPGKSTITERRKAAIQHAKKASKLLPRKTSYSEARSYLRGPDIAAHPGGGATPAVAVSPSQSSGKRGKGLLAPSKKQNSVGSAKRISMA